MSGFFGAVAPYYDGFMSMIGNNKNLKLILKKIDPSPHHLVLDVGGGTGTLASKILEQGSSVYVVDTSEEMLDIARKKGLSEENLIVADASNLPFEDNKFDYLICSDALHHFKEKEKGIYEMARVLKKEGEIIILEFDPRRLTTKVLKLIEKTLGEPTEFYSPEKLQNLLDDVGIKGKIQNINRWQYLFQGKKNR